MKSATTLAVLSALSPAVLAQGNSNSEVFSQYFGTTSVVPPTETAFSKVFAVCTNYVSSLSVISGLPSSASVALESQQVKGVCEVCTSLSQSRIDSCCGVSTSVGCFEAFAPSATLPASTAASTTGGSASTITSSVDPADDIFSYFFGATSVAAPSISGFSQDWALCTNYVDKLPAITNVPASARSSILSQEVGGVCGICTSLSQSRIDSCCGKPTSVSCFNAYATGAPATTGAPSTNSTNGTMPAPGSVSGLSTFALTTSTSAGATKIGAAGSLAMAFLGVVGWVL